MSNDFQYVLNGNANSSVSLFKQLNLATEQTNTFDQSINSKALNIVDKLNARLAQASAIIVSLNIHFNDEFDMPSNEVVQNVLCAVEDSLDDIKSLTDKFWDLFRNNVK